MATVGGRLSAEIMMMTKCMYCLSTSHIHSYVYPNHTHEKFKLFLCQCKYGTLDGWMECVRHEMNVKKVNLEMT